MKKRLAFERLLVKLGYRDRMPIYEKEDKKYQQTNFKCTDGAMAIYTFLIVYKTKKSYLWLEFLDNYDDPDLENKIRRLAKKIRFYEKTRLIEVGYEVKYTKQPSEFSLEERRKIFHHFILYTHKHLSNGVLDETPRPGDVLAAKPHGPKINEGFTESSLSVGKRQRSIVARRFGFGELFDDGFQYARYNENCHLEPI